MNKSRVAFICPSRSWGGLEMNVLKLCIWLNKRGRNILLYCSSGSELYVQAEKQSIDLRVLNSDSKLLDILQASKLARSFKKEKVGIALFHINRNFPMMSLTKILSKKKFKLLYMQHMHLGGSKKDFLHRQIYKQLDCWIAPLQMFAKRLLEITTIPKEKIEVIPFGIELHRFIECPLTQSEAREKLHLPLDSIIVGFVGRIDPKKCQHLLVETAYKLLQKGITINLLFVGDSTKNEELQYRGEICTLIDSYNLNDKVHFRSHLDNVEEAFKALDIFCLTTGSETFGMVTVEAMASGLVVLGSNAGGTTEIIEHEENGLLYRSQDSVDLADTIKRVLQDNMLQLSLSKRARENAQKKYSHKVQCDLLENCFEKFKKR